MTKVKSYILNDLGLKNIKSVLLITNNNSWDNNLPISKNSQCYDDLKEAGVLDIWCEENIQPEERFFTMGFHSGAFQLRVVDKKVFHKDEEITQFVTGLIKEIRGIPGRIVSNNRSKRLQIDLNGLVFNVTGCEKVKTSFKQWQEVYDFINL